MERNTTIIPVTLANGVKLNVEAMIRPAITDAPLDDEGAEIETDVALSIPTLKEISEAIEGVAMTVKKSFATVKPSKATVEFGLEFGGEAGQITALLVKGTSKANLKVTLQFDNPAPAPATQ
jgi:hypothetical protein